MLCPGWLEAKRQGNVAWVVVVDPGRDICWINECKESKAIAKHAAKHDLRAMGGEMKKWMQDVHGGPNEIFSKSINVYVFIYV